MEENLLQLERRVDDLLTWVRARKQERLVYNLDLNSTTTLQKRHVNLLIATGRVIDASAGQNMTSDTLFFGMIVFLNGKKRVIFSSLPYRSFTVNTATDVCTNTSGQHNLANGTMVAVGTTDTLPSPLTISGVYFVINRTGNTFQLSSSSGGSPIDLTTTGLGTNFYAPIT